MIWCEPCRILAGFTHIGLSAVWVVVLSGSKTQTMWSWSRVRNEWGNKARWTFSLCLVQSLIPIWWNVDLDESEVSEDWVTRHLAGIAGFCVESD